MIDAKGMFRAYVSTVCWIVVAVGAIVWLAFFAACKVWTHFRDDRPDAYILVRGDRAVPLWDYQQLPMKDCAWCHRTVNLNRHHVIPQAANPALRDVRSNLVVLCRDCHFVLGHRCNWKRYNPDVMYICTHYTNVVWSSDTREALGGQVPPPPPGPVDAEPILHVTNDVPEKQRAALERILKWNEQENPPSPKQGLRPSEAR